MGLREEIEAAFGEAAADGGVRVLSIDGDDEVWAAGLGATDGAAAAVSALVDGLGVPADASAAVSFSRRPDRPRGARHRPRRSPSHPSRRLSVRARC
jgi:hypothetical protein